MDDEVLQAILEELRIMNNRRRRMWDAFLGGIWRGIGVMIGFAIVGTALLMMVQRIASANLPVISDFLAQVVTMVQLRIK